MLNQTVSTTAILIFNSPEKQKASLKKIAPRISDKRLDGLIDQLNDRAKQLAKQAALPFFQVNAVSTCSFAEQLYDAYLALFNQGFETVIGISNDCPALSKTDLLKAKEQLAKGNTVLGPASDGGLYLLGLSKDSIGKSEFLNLNWRSESLFTSFIELLEGQASYCTLTTKSDMDTVGEFQRAFSSNIQFINALKSQLFSFCKQLVIKKVEIVSVRFLSVFLQRGPPVID